MQRGQAFAAVGRAATPNCALNTRLFVAKESRIRCECPARYVRARLRRFASATCRSSPAAALAVAGQGRRLDVGDKEALSNPAYPRRTHWTAAYLALIAIEWPDVAMRGRGDIRSKRRDLGRGIGTFDEGAPARAVWKRRSLSRLVRRMAHNFPGYKRRHVLHGRWHQRHPSARGGDDGCWVHLRGRLLINS